MISKIITSIKSFISAPVAPVASLPIITPVTNIGSPKPALAPPYYTTTIVIHATTEKEMVCQLFDIYNRYLDNRDKASTMSHDTETHSWTAKFEYTIKY